MKYKKDELENLIFNEELSYREIGRRYGVSDTYIKKISKKLGIKLEKRKKFPNDFVSHNKKKKKIKVCKNCNKEFEIKEWPKQIFCNFECSVEFKINKKYENYIKNQEEYFGKYRDMKFIKRHILIEQKCKCSICDMRNVWNGKELVFVLDHIDGDAYNNLRNNLRLICHNCDSQLETYKSKNKNSARKERYLKNYKTYEKEER